MSPSPRNGEVSKTFITLTYSQQAAPSNDKELKRHISLWVNRVSRQGIRGLWVIEFTQKGIPHIHVLTPCEVDRLRITKAWQDVTGQRLPACVDIRTVYDATGLESYLGKMRTKLAPTSFGLVHRWYGVFGGFVRRVIISVATGTQSAIAPVLRLIRRIAHVSPNRKTLWGFSRRTGRTEAITRYARYLGVSP